jgi:nondiscriminating aspartyl-tRNA synthetase
MRTLCKELSTKIGEKVIVKGWVHRIRDLGGVVFVILRDRSGQVQLVFDEKPDFTHESIISATGPVTENEKAPGGVEIKPETLVLLAPADPDLPLPVNQDPSKHNIDAILDNRLISLRMPKVRAIFELQSAILKYLSQYMHSQDFSEIKTSKLIGSGTEGGTGPLRGRIF